MNDELGIQRKETDMAYLRCPNSSLEGLREITETILDNQLPG